MINWRKTTQKNKLSKRNFLQSALVSMVIVALLFSSMGMQLSLLKPAVDLSSMNSHSANMDNRNCMMDGMDCYACGMHMQKTGQMCSCPICAAIRGSISMNMNTLDTSHASIAPCSISSLPCSAPMQFMVVMVNLGWDIPKALYAHPAVLATGFAFRSNDILPNQHSLSIEPPPPCSLFV